MSRFDNTTPFEHPDVQAFLRENTAEVLSTGLGEAFRDHIQRCIVECRMAQKRDEKPRGGIVRDLQSALSAELPFAGVESIQEYETLERTLYLVKVTNLGEIASGSLAKVIILDHLSDVPLDVDADFTQDHVSQMQHMLERQKELGWQPVFNEALHHQ